MKRYRKPSFKKSFSAKTTGRMSRTIKSAYTPNYGKKGNGWITDPKKAAYNHVYNRTTQSIYDKSSCYTNYKPKLTVGDIFGIIGIFLGFVVSIAMIAFYLILIGFILWFMCTFF